MTVSAPVKKMQALQNGKREHRPKVLANGNLGDPKNDMFLVPEMLPRMRIPYKTAHASTQKQ